VNRPDEATANRNSLRREVPLADARGVVEPSAAIDVRIRLWRSRLVPGQSGEFRVLANDILSKRAAIGDTNQLN